MAILGWYMTYKWVSFQTLMNDISPTFWTWATQVWPTLLGEKCPITAQVLWFWTMVASIFLYVIGSLIHGQSFDMDELLHQNKLAEETKEELSPLKRVIGMGKEFSLGDRLLLLGSYAYVTIFFLIFMIGTVTMLNTDISDQAWGTFWWWFCIAILLITLTITATIGLGGLKNLREMYALLANIKRNEADDGTVLGHRNLADITPIKQNK